MSNLSRNAIVIDYRDGWYVNNGGVFHAQLEHSKVHPIPTNGFQKEYKKLRKRARLYQDGEECGYPDKLSVIRDELDTENQCHYLSVQKAPWTFRWNNKRVIAWLDENGMRNQPVAAIAHMDGRLWGNIVLEYENQRYEFTEEDLCDELYERVLRAHVRYIKRFDEQIKQLQEMGLISGVA